MADNPNHESVKDDKNVEDNTKKTENENVPFEEDPLVETLNLDPDKQNALIPKPALPLLMKNNLKSKFSFSFLIQGG